MGNTLPAFHAELSMSAIRFLLAGAAGSLLSISTPAQDCVVESEQKISETQGGFGGTLLSSDRFGRSIAALGDVDGDGVTDLAVGAYEDDDGGGNQGAVWILFLNADGTVASEQKISETAGGFGGALDPLDRFGTSVAPLGDLDGNGAPDVAVGALGDDDGATDQGAVWILLLNADGTVGAEQKISEAAGGFGGLLDAGDRFGTSVASLGDLDGDGTVDLAVGADFDDDGGSDQGAVWILFLNAGGTVAAEQKISETVGGFGGVLAPDDFFGVAAAPLGDLDGDGITDLAVGAVGDDDGSSSQGAVWILFLNADGTVAGEQKISETAGGFGGDLDADEDFGISIASLGDFDGDGLPDLAVGAGLDDDGGSNQGAVWLLSMNADGTVAGERKISETSGGFEGVLDPGDRCGTSVASLGDLDGDGVIDLAVGAINDDDGGADQGALWVLFLSFDSTPPTISSPPIVSVIDRKASPGEIVYFTVTASDDCDPAPALVCVPPCSYFPRGTTMVTCTATDAACNQSVSQFPVVVMPTALPRTL